MPIQLYHRGEHEWDMQYLACPYTEYIPILYLMKYPSNFYIWKGSSLSITNSTLQRMSMLSPFNKYTMEEIVRKIKGYSDMFISALLSSYIYGNVCEKENVFEKMEEYMNYDEPWGFGGPIIDTGVNNAEELMRNFKFAHGAGYRALFHLPETILFSVPYIWGHAQGDKWIPTVVGVIPKENYAYVRAHFLLTGDVDLTKCVFLVSNDINDSTNDAVPAKAREFFKTHILPFLQRLNCTIARVSTKFIQEKCFIKGYELSAKSITERKREAEELIDKMYNYVLKGITPEQPELRAEAVPETTIMIDSVSDNRAHVGEPGESGIQAAEVDWRTYTVNFTPNSAEPTPEISVWNPTTAQTTPQRGIMEQMRDNLAEYYRRTPTEDNRYTILVGQEMRERLERAFRESLNRQAGVTPEQVGEVLTDPNPNILEEYMGSIRPEPPAVTEEFREMVRQLEEGEEQRANEDDTPVLPF